LFYEFALLSRPFQPVLVKGQLEVCARSLDALSRTHKSVPEGAEQHLPTVVGAFEGREVSRPVELDQLRPRQP